MMKHRHNEPTPEQRERIRAATEEAARIFLQMQEEMKKLRKSAEELGAVLDQVNIEK